MIATPHKNLLKPSLLRKMVMNIYILNEKEPESNVYVTLHTWARYRFRIRNYFNTSISTGKVTEGREKQKQSNCLSPAIRVLLCLSLNT